MPCGRNNRSGGLEKIMLLYGRGLVKPSRHVKPVNSSSPAFAGFQLKFEAPTLGASPLETAVYEQLRLHCEYLSMQTL